MNETISALMDGELERDEARQAIRGLANDASRRASWDEYHLIGAAMRGEFTGEVERRQQSAQAIFVRLAAEPTVLAPVAMKIAPVEKRTRMALAMAASVVTVSAIAVVAFKQQSGMVAPVQLVQQVAPAPVVQQTSAAEVRVNDYLAIHRQFANPQALQTASARRDGGR